MVEIFNALSTAAVIVEEVLIMLVIGALFSKQETAVSRVVARHALLGVFVISLLSVLGSLFYSNVIGYEPCVLCWWQRVFLYPIPIILFVGWRAREDYARPVLVLSFIGAAIAAYHYYGQMFNASTLPCAAPTAGGISCASRYVYTLGYITIPMMSLTAFMLIASILMLYLKKRKSVQR